MTAAKETVALAAVLSELDRISLLEKNRSARIEGSVKNLFLLYSGQALARL